MPAVRRLAAIIAADVAGYSRLMGVDEEGRMKSSKPILRNWSTLGSRSTEAES
jgi:hypothetical protein